MRRNSAVLLTIALAVTTYAGAAAAAEFAGPSRWITGNDTGGILPYSPQVQGTYPQIAADYCARWHRLAHITSVHPRYGDYISWVCIDKPWIIH